MMSYYGRLDGELLGKGFVEYMLDEKWNEIIARQEKLFIKKQESIIRDAKSIFKQEIHSLKKANSELKKKLSDSENKIRQIVDDLKEMKKRKFNKVEE